MTLVSRRYIFFICASLTGLMGAIDATIVAVALPQLQRELGASIAWIGWTLTVYQLVQVLAMPIMGKLSDSIGRRKVFLFCVVSFTLGSVLCGLSPNVYFLVVFRGLQAIGAGGMLPSAIGLISDQFPERRAQMVGLFSSIFPLGGVIGPNLGGYILQNWSWRDIFFINIPIGLITFVGIFAFLTGKDVGSGRKFKADYPGLVLFAVATVALLGGMTAAGEDPEVFSNPFFWISIVLSAVCYVLFVRHIRRAAEPMISYNLLFRHPFWAANLYNFFFGASVFGFGSFLPFYAVTKYQLSAQASGAVLTPRAAAMALMSVLTSLFIIKLGYRLPMIVGMLFISLSMLLLGQGWTTVVLGGIQFDGFVVMASIVLLTGIGMGISGPAANNAALDLAPDQAAQITGLRGMFRTMGGIIGIASVVLVLSLSQDRAAALSHTFLVLSALTLVTIPLTLVIPDTARDRRRQSTPREVEAVLEPVKAT